MPFTLSVIRTRTPLALVLSRPVSLSSPRTTRRCPSGGDGPLAERPQEVGLGATRGSGAGSRRNQGPARGSPSGAAAGVDPVVPARAGHVRPSIHRSCTAIKEHCAWPSAAIDPFLCGHGRGARRSHLLRQRPRPTRSSMPLPSCCSVAHLAETSSLVAKQQMFSFLRTGHREGSGCSSEIYDAIKII